MLEGLPYVIGAYLWGAVPTAYLVGRYVKGIDIREYGSGNVGATNVMTHVGLRTGFLLGTFDCLAKGTLPVVAANLLDQSLTVQVTMGLVAMAGHSWSPYLRFTGGRGVATAVGVVLGMAMFWEFLVLTVVMGAIGRLIFRETGFWTFVSIFLLPGLAYLFSRPTEVFYMTLTIGLLLIMKRLTANWEPFSGEYSLMRVAIYRALWDRDVPKKVQWTRRQPVPDAEGYSGDSRDDALR